jgi:hypothetical protein
MVNIDKNLQWIRESQDSAFTILMWEISKDDLVNELKHRLALISNIKNTFKRAKLNDRLYEYLIQIEKSSIQIYSQIVLIGSSGITIYKLEKSEINLLKEYSVPKFTIENNENFNIGWLVDLFKNFKFYDVIINNSNILTHWSGNQYKKKIIKQNINLEYIKNLNSGWFFFGKMQSQFKTKFLIEHNQNNMSWNDIILNIEKFEMKKKIQDLQDQIDKMFICNDKFIFGNDIYEYIKNYNVKHLYIHTDIKKIFDNVIIEKDLIANLNFNIIEINSIDNNINASNVLLENYSGFIGIKYF